MLYRKRKKLDVAEKKLKNARNKLEKVVRILNKYGLKLEECLLLLEANLDKELADLSISQFKGSLKNELPKQALQHY